MKGQPAILQKRLSLTERCPCGHALITSSFEPDGGTSGDLATKTNRDQTGACSPGASGRIFRCVRVVFNSTREHRDCAYPCDAITTWASLPALVDFRC